MHVPLRLKCAKKRIKIDWVRDGNELTQPKVKYRDYRLRLKLRKLPPIRHTKCIILRLQSIILKLTSISSSCYRRWPTSWKTRFMSFVLKNLAWPLFISLFASWSWWLITFIIHIITLGSCPMRVCPVYFASHTRARAQNHTQHVNHARLIRPEQVYFLSASFTCPPM